MKLVQSTTDIPNDPILTFAPPHLIRLKQAFLLQQVLIVVVIKGIRGHQIKGCQVSISGVIWTIPSSSVSKTGINAFACKARYKSIQIVERTREIYELKLGNAVFSLSMVGDSSSKMEASQPWTKQSWKWRRTREAAMRRSLDTACLTAVLSSQSSTLSNNIRTTDGYVLPTMGKEMIHKKPSGPNPIGNQQPPTRP
nr:uncharacterized protein LOC109156308 [Ipomoea batatas]